MVVGKYRVDDGECISMEELKVRIEANLTYETLLIFLYYKLGVLSRNDVYFSTVIDLSVYRGRMSKMLMEKL